MKSLASILKTAKNKPIVKTNVILNQKVLSVSIAGKDMCLFLDSFKRYLNISIIYLDSKGLKKNQKLNNFSIITLQYYRRIDCFRNMRRRMARNSSR